MRIRKITVLALAFCLGLLPVSVSAGQASSIGKGVLHVLGMGFLAEPEHQTAPINMGTAVNTRLFTPDYDGVESAIPPEMTNGLTVVADLSGPGISTPRKIESAPGEQLVIPPLPQEGTYVLDNIRLMRGEQLVMYASPSMARIDTIKKLLITQVTSRALSIDEIEKLGISVTSDNLTAYKFTVGFGTETGEVKMDIPIVMGRNDEPGDTGTLMPAEMPNPDVKPVPYFKVPNLSVEPVLFKPGPSDDAGSTEINIPVAGAIVIPGDIAFLNQFFEVMLLVTNNAPDGSALKVTDINAEIVLPAGDDNMPGSTDDPLRLANAGSGVQPIAKVLNAAGGGSAVGPHESGEGRFLVEGLREGTHRLEIKITATLTGLPSGPVQVSGSATGTVIVRNPNFTLTFGQPDVVRDGEEYSLFVTVHNTSETTANLVQLTLPPQAVYGATMIDDSDPATPVGTVGMRTIAAGDSVVAEFRMIARKTGKVTSAAYAGDEGAKGVFRLRTGVDDRGVPLSPDTIVLQDWVKVLPHDLFYHAMRVLGLAHSAATAPVMPKDAVRIPKQNVVKRAWELSEAGLRVKMGETLQKSAADLVIGWLGSGFRDKGFEQILRTTDAGRSFLFEAGKILAGSGDLLAAQRAFGDTVKYRGPFVSAAIENTGDAIAYMEMTDAGGLSLGRRAGGSAVRDIPYGVLIDMDGDSAAASGEMALVDADEGNAYDLKITGIQTGEINFGLILPVEGGGFVHAEYRNVYVRAGEIVTGRIVAGGAVPVLMLGPQETGPTGTYAYEYPAGPRAVAAMQLAEADEDGFGRVVAVLFDEKLDTESAKKLANYGLAYRSEDMSVLNDPKDVKVFPSGRIVEVIFEGTVSPFFDYDLTVSGITDPDGNAQEPLSAKVPVKTTLDTPGGIVSGTVLRANGEAIAHTQVMLGSWNSVGRWIPYGRTLTDEDGQYRLDYVKMDTPFIVESSDPSNGQTGNVSASIFMEHQQMQLDIILLGLGTVSGQVVMSDNVTSVADAVVELSSMTSSEKFITKADSAGRFSFEMVPVGNVNLNAARKEFRGAIGVNIPQSGDSVNVTLPVYSMLGDTGSLKGRVFASDGKTPMAKVPVIVDASSYSFSDWRETDADGYYFFESVPQREISVYSFRQETGEEARATVTLEGSETAVVNLVFTGTAKLAGTIYDHTGLPIAGASVVAGVSLVNSDENGNFTIEAVPTGLVKVEAQRQEDKTHIETVWAYIGAPGETAYVAIMFPEPRRTGIIQGYAKDAYGKPLRNQEVCAYVREVYLNCVNTDANGFYSGEFPLNKYTVFMVNSGYTDADRKQVELAVSGQVVNLADLRFKGFGRVTGTIYQPDGESPIIASVIFTRTLFTHLGSPYTQQERYISNQLTADGLTGRFTIDKVLVGDFRLESFNAFNSDPVAHTGKVRNPDEVVTVDLVLRPTSVVRGQVFLANGDRAGANVVVTIKTPTISEMQVKTATDGSYRFDLVPPSTFTLEAYDPVTGNFGVSRCSVGTGDEAVVDIHILGRGTVSVSVVDGGGNPVANARVKLESGSAIAYLAGEFPTLVTGQNGEVTFRNVPEGGYSVTAEDPATLTGGKAGGSIPEDNIEMHSTVVVSAAGTVSGMVLMPDGVTPVPYAQVKLNRDFRPPFFTTSDAEGRYLFDYVPLGAFRLEVFHPATGRTGVASDTVDYDTQKLTVDIKLLANGTVEGYVLMSSGEPVGSAMVTLASSTVSNAGAIVMTSNMEGRFKVSGVPEGGYTVTAQHPFWNISGTVNGAIKTEGETVRTDVRFEPTGTISGRTLAADGVTPVPYAKVKITGGTYAILMYNFARNEYMSAPVQAVSDFGGNFVFETVPLGRYKLTANEQTGLDGGSVDVAMTTGDSVVHADIVFVGTGNIAGRVVNSDGTSPGRSVELALQVTGPLANSFTGFSDSDGNFAFYGIPAGDFSIYAHVPGSRLGGIYNGVLSEDGATIGDVLIPIESSGEIKGTVLREDGVTPVQEALITCYVTRASGTGVMVYALTDKSGNFSVNGIPLGTFRISAIDYSSGGIGAAAGTLGNEASTLVLPPIILDEHKPYVVSMRPKPGSIQVPLDSAITIQFSEPVDATLINRNNIRITSNGKDIAGALSLSPDRKSVMFTPASRLPEFAPITVAVASMRDDIGKSMEEPYAGSFTTADITPPSIVSARLIKGAFVVEFSEPVVRASAVVGITRTDTGETVSGFLALSAQDMVATYYPDNPLADATSFMFYLSGIADAFGNAAQDFSAVFSTGDKTAPVISLALSSTVAIEGVPVTVTATPQASPDLFVVDFSVNGQRVKSVNRPPYKIDISPTETITVSATPMDYAGNMGQAASTTISVVPNNPPVAAILAPQTGTAIGTGQAIGVRVEASDDLGLKEIEMRVRSTGISDTVVHAVGTGALSAERFFTVSVPASSKSGMEISVEVVARDMRGVESAPARLLLHTIDKTPPSVEITSFKTGFNVSPGDSIPVNVFVSDNETVSSIEFRTEGGLQLSATALPDAPASDAIGKFTLTVPGNYAGGTKIIVAPYAVDAAGNIGRARPVTLTVDDVAPPTVAIASPATGSSVIARDTVTVRVRAADNDAVDRVEFFLNGKIFATDRYESGGYYETTFIAQAEPGSVELSAKAFDKSGKSAESVNIFVNVVSGGNVAGNANVISVQGHLAAIGGSNGLMKIYDVSTAKSPVLLGVLNSDDSRPIKQIRIIGNRLYAADDYTMKIVDINAPESPAALASIDTYADRFDVFEGKLFLLSGWRLKVYAVSGNVPELINDSSLPDRFRDIRIDGKSGYLYALGDSYLCTLQISDRGISEIARIPISGAPKRLAIAGNNIYIANGNGIVVVDASNPLTPTIIAIHEAYEGAMSVAMLGGLSVVTTGNSSGLSLFNTLSTSDASYLGAINLSGAIKDVSLSQGHAYVAKGLGGFAVVSIGNTSPVVWNDLISLSEPKADGTIDVVGLPMAVMDENAYVDVKVTNIESGAVVTATVESGSAFNLNVHARTGEHLVLDAIETMAPFQRSCTVYLGRVPAGEITERLTWMGEAQAIDVNGNHIAVVDSDMDIRLFYSDGTPEGISYGGKLHSGYSAAGVRMHDGRVYSVGNGELRIFNWFGHGYPLSETPVAAYQLTSVDVYNGIAFLGGNGVVAVYDVRNAEHPHFLGEKQFYGAEGGILTDVSVDGRSGRLYAVTDNGDHSYLVAMDIRNLADITELCRVKLPGKANRLNIIDGVAYIAAQTGLAIIKLDRVGSAAFGTDGDNDGVADDVLSYTATKGMAYDVAVVGRYVYVTAGSYYGVQVFDVTSPIAPVEVGTIQTGGWPFCLGVVGAVLYVGDSKGLSVVRLWEDKPVIDLDLVRLQIDPAESGVMATGSRGSVTAGRYPVAVKVQSMITGQTYAALVNDADRGAFSVSLPYLPGDSIAISLEDAGGTIVGPFEIGHVSALDVATSFSWGASVLAIDVDSRLAAVIESGSLRMFDVSDKENPAEVGFVNAGSAIRKVRIAGDRVYAVGGSMMHIYDISDPAHPELLSLLEIGYEIHSLEILNDMAFLGTLDGITVYNVREGWHPVLVTSRHFGIGSFTDVRVDSAAGLLYAVTDDGVNSHLIAFDVHDVSNIIDVGRIDIPGKAGSVEVVDGKAYIAARTCVVIVSLDRLGSPEFGKDGNNDGIADDILSYIETPWNAYDVAVMNGYAYVAGNAGVQVFDVTNPLIPVKAEEVWTGLSATDMAVVGPYFYVGDSDGLNVIKTYLGIAPVLDETLVMMTIEKSTSSVLVTGSAGAVTDDVYPVIVDAPAKKIHAICAFMRPNRLIGV